MLLLLSKRSLKIWPVRKWGDFLPSRSAAYKGHFSQGKKEKRRGKEKEMDSIDFGAQKKGGGGEINFWNEFVAVRLKVLSSC